MRRLAVFLTLLAPAMLAAQDPVITELMARNANTLADRDGEYPDWFEAHNPKASSIQLGGYYVRIARVGTSTLGATCASVAERPVEAQRPLWIHRP